MPEVKWNSAMYLILSLLFMVEAAVKSCAASKPKFLFYCNESYTNLHVATLLNFGSCDDCEINPYPVTSII